MLSLMMVAVLFGSGAAAAPIELVSARAESAVSSTGSALPGYLFSGVRPSPGAETLENDGAREISDTMERAQVAAAGDGRTPLNRYLPGGNGRSAGLPTRGTLATTPEERTQHPQPQRGAKSTKTDPLCDSGTFLWPPLFPPLAGAPAVFRADGYEVFPELFPDRDGRGSGELHFRKIFQPANIFEDASADAQASFSARVRGTFGPLPLLFEPADGSDVAFVCRGPGYALLVSPAEAVVTINRKRRVDRAARITRLSGAVTSGEPALHSRAPVASLQMRLAGADREARVVGAAKLATTVNYLIGNDPRRWRTGVPTFSRIHFQNVYPGVDLVYYGNQRQLEYDFIVAPGADPYRIALRFEGAEQVEVDARGDLIVGVAGGQVRQHKPVVFQEINGARREIAGRYVLVESSRRTVGLEIGDYDRNRPLVIDPALVYSSYLGGTDFDRAWDIAVDAQGNAYLAGETSSTNLAGAGAPASAYNGGLCDVFVAKVAASGTNLVYATYLGGNDEDAAFGIALDPAGNVYVAGLTSSTNFPVTTNAVSSALHGTPYFGHYPYDAFVAKLDTSGGRLLYATYLGGTNADVASAIAVDGNGNVYITGETTSGDFPTNAVSSAFGGFHDAWVAKLTGTDSNLVYSTFLGGTGDDRGQGIAVDSSGNAVVVGYTSSIDFPVTNALQTNFAGGLYDIFVTKLGSDGATKLFSSYLGGSGSDEAFRVALDGAGSAYLTGSTTSTNFPGASLPYSTNSGFADAFVLKLDATGTNLVYSSYLGGLSNDQGWSIAVDRNGSAYVVGTTASSDFPTTNAFQSALAGSDDAFVAKVNAGGTALEYATFFGGSGSDQGYGIALDNAGNAYVAGTTASLDFPVFPSTNGIATAFAGGTGDAFLAKFFPRNATLRAARGTGSESNDVTILWPYGLPDYHLEFATGLEGTNTTWMTVTNAPTGVGDDYTVTLTNSSGDSFFRLRRVQ